MSVCNYATLTTFITEIWEHGGVPKIKADRLRGSDSQIIYYHNKNSK